MPKGEKLLRFMAKLMLDRLYGIVTIHFEAGKVTHVVAENRRIWPYEELPDHVPESGATKKALAR